MIKDSPIIKNIQLTSNECNTSEEEVERVVDLTYEFIRHKIQSQDFPSMDLEELQQAKKNFIIPALGKLYVSEGKFKHLNKLI